MVVTRKFPTSVASNAYTNLFVTKDQIAWLISDSRIKAVALTGSEGTGRK